MPDGSNRSMQHFWLGGSSNEPNPTGCVLSMQHFWMGGVCADQTIPPGITGVQVVKAVSVGRLMNKGYC
jgi:hypothetical protein